MRVEVKRVRTFDVRGMVYRSSNPGEEAVVATQLCVQQATAIWVGEADGVEVCAIGVVPPTIFASEAYLWMLHTHVCEEHPVRFIRWSRRVLADALALYPRLHGLCNPSNLRSRRWLEWLGADIDPNGAPYRKFWING